MKELDQKINTHFPGLVVRKDLVKTVKGNAIVPTFVLEYLLGQYCATSDEATIQTGIETVKDILRKHHVHRNEAGLVRSNIKEKGRYKVIDKIGVSLNDNADVYEAEFSNLGIKKVLVDSGTIKAHPKLLVSGVWCIADIKYAFTEDKNTSPWILSTLKPIQYRSLYPAVLPDAQFDGVSRNGGKAQAQGGRSRRSPDNDRRRIQKRPAERELPEDQGILRYGWHRLYLGIRRNQDHSCPPHCDRPRLEYPHGSRPGYLPAL